MAKLREDFLWGGAVAATNSKAVGKKAVRA